ncbi:MAG: tRNA pseudouridine(55) synthase TruB [Patescibacteria group bacterium]
MQGIIPVLKPKGPTSHDIVAAVRRMVGARRVGHAGTLDPLASGVLVIGIGSATKQLHNEMLKEKEYEAEITLGATTTTDDAEGERTDHDVPTPPTRTDIEAILPEYIGNIQQLPPAFSAVKVGGIPAYAHARKGRVVTLGARSVEIMSIEIFSYAWPKLSLRVVTGPGVYIRSLARDIGERLGCGGYISELVRTRVGEFYIADAVPVEGVPEYLLEQEQGHPSS